MRLWGDTKPPKFSRIRLPKCLLSNLGIEVSDLGFFHGKSTKVERAAVEKTVKENLDAGRPCSLANLEHQLIYGYDDDRFLVKRPRNNQITHSKLTFGTWQEFGEACFVTFFAYRKGTRKDDLTNELNAMANVEILLGKFLTENESAWLQNCRTIRSRWRLGDVFFFEQKLRQRTCFNDVELNFLVRQKTTRVGEKRV